VVIDAVSRLIPGVLGNEGSLGDESFEHDLLEYPQYTRPAAYRGWSVPDVLLSGHHAEIDRWRLEQQGQRTRDRRPDLWERHIGRKRRREEE
jgi:tRNA (guanine37-N1)-methyltransferase